MKRRDALKKILVGGSVALGAGSLPERWTRPVVERVMVPAHAQTSPPVPTTSTTPAPGTTVPPPKTTHQPTTTPPGTTPGTTRPPTTPPPETTPPATTTAGFCWLRIAKVRGGTIHVLYYGERGEAVTVYAPAGWAVLVQMSDGRETTFTRSATGLTITVNGCVWRPVDIFIN